VLLPASQQAPAAAAQAAGEIARKGEETILVIDDEEVVRHVAQSALGMLGYQVIVTERGAEGLDAIRQNTAISLVLLDMSMPGLSGKEVLEALRKIRPDLPVIVCSGYSEGEVFRQFSGLKMDGVLQKPFTNVALTSKIRSVLDAQKKNFIAN
jgi:CheY-like chemotaxis protein